MAFSPSALKKKLEEQRLLKDSAIFTEGPTDPSSALQQSTENAEVSATTQLNVATENVDVHVTETTVSQDVTQASALAKVVAKVIEQPMGHTVEQTVEQPAIAPTEEIQVPDIKPIEQPMPAQEEPKPQPPVLESTPNLGDTSVFQKISASVSQETPVIDSYAEMVENMVSTQCQLSGVKNLDLTTFGVRAQVIKFPNLSVLEYGKHKFLGAPFTEEEENSIMHKIALHVATSNKETIVIRAVQEVRDSHGLVFHSLLFNDSIAKKFVNMFNYAVYTNPNEADVSKLVLVIKKQ